MSDSYWFTLFHQCSCLKMPRFQNSRLSSARKTWATEFILLLYCEHVDKRREREKGREREKKKKRAWYEWRDQSNLCFSTKSRYGSIVTESEFPFLFFLKIKSNLLVGLCRTSHCRTSSTRTSKSIADQAVGTSHGVGTIGKSAVGCGAKRGLTTSRLSGFLDG